MANFMNLVQNENMKIYSRIRTWIMLGLIVLIPILISIIVLLAGGGDDTSSWSMMLLESIFVFMLITIFTVVVASDSVAGEFSQGTIKLLLIRPWSRSSILLSKYIATILFAIGFTIVAFVVMLLVNIACFGYSSGSQELSDGMLTGISDWNFILQVYLFRFITLILIVTFGFMMSSAFRSSGLAIGLSIAFLLAGNIITGLFAMADKPWVKYVLFMHLDLSSYINGGSGPIPNHPTTLGFSLAVLAVYFVIFNAISWTVFTKRDVAA
ncbi:ABC transporter permease subunit [Cohnella cholangitidis]|uniref:ABC transporter permease subunit n=1 Tax=Cohnella cholangitidis TaxID=2598458 RepID=A0A7G5C1Y3_9BACL|nr:ABC transporter permease subunit [Cohnella cholangitidis]